jgi:hypothetical protein
LKSLLDQVYKDAHQDVINKSGKDTDISFSKLLQKAEWDEIVAQWSPVILEEHSVMLPTRPSPFVSHIIFAICENVQNAGGHLLTSVR